MDKENQEQNQAASEPVSSEKTNFEQKRLQEGKFWTLVFIFIAVFFAIGVLVTLRDVVQRYIHPMQPEPPIITTTTKETSNSVNDDSMMDDDKTMEDDAMMEDADKDTETVTDEVMDDIDSMEKTDLETDFDNTGLVNELSE